MNDSEKKYITPDQAADYLGVKKHTLEAFRMRGGGPKFHRFGYRTVRYTIAELDEWAASLEFNSTAEYPPQ